jgi:acyl carrier protein
MSAPSPELADSIRSLVLDRFAPGFPRPLRDDEQLTDAGALDSLRMVEFVLALEEQFGIRVDASDITPDNFGTINDIAAYVSRQRAR